MFQPRPTDKISAIHEAVVRIEERQKSSLRRMDQVEDTLYGNGDEGLKARVTRIEEQRKVLDHVKMIGIAVVAAVGTMFGKDATG